MFVEEFGLYLFDLDGLLVDTEKLHHRAFLSSCEEMGAVFPLDFFSYCNLAHQGPTELKDYIFSRFPHMTASIWSYGRERKKQLFLELVEKEGVLPMPGADSLVTLLQKKNIPSCIVTNSSKEEVSLIKKQAPFLHNIPYVITREDYTEPKPSPEGYNKAIALYGKKGVSCIGFEDSPRGIKALEATDVRAVLIADPRFSHVQNKSDKVLHFVSFNDFLINLN